ncbi:syntaxin-binding protein 6 isoform X1 [Phyllostomus discolor]|uniref:Syntaxin-binding protein 6 n=1 Tax=Phyllostomus discolor TaxID=89673 RepID=A0A7E6E2D9_9CHIR|nr:syntaxin-binding protein 6 isoform X1 [Phyllostomus discolor]
MKLALRPAHFFSPALCSRAPSPAQGLPWVSHRLRSGAWRSGPGPQAQLPVPSPGAQARSRRHWACSELAAGAGLLRRRSHSAAGGRARGCSWSSGAWSWSCREFPLHPSLFPRGSRSRRGSRERRPASTLASRALSGARSSARGSPRGGASPLGRVPHAGSARARAKLHENSLRALFSCSTMSAKSAISKEIFAPLDERMLGAVQVKRRTKKKIPFLATGGQGEYLTYICLSVTNKKPTQASITKVKQFEGSTSFVRRSQWMLEQLRQVNGIDPNRDSAEFDLLFENAFDQWVASTASEKCTFFQILHHTCQRYLTDRKPEFINCQSKIMGGNSILHSAADSVTSAVQKASQALNERGERLGRAEEKTEDMKNSAQQFAETAHKLAMKHKC